MSQKKNKAFELELIEDLLQDDSVADVSDGPPAVTQKIAPKITDQHHDKDKLNLDKTIAFGRDDDMSTAIVGATKTGQGTAPIHDPTEISDSGGPLSGSSSEPDPTVRVSAQQALKGSGSEGPKVKASVGRYGGLRPQGPANATDAALAQSENLRIAQNRLMELEQEIERLRLQNEELGAAGETLRRRADELQAAAQKREADYRSAVSSFAQEKEILSGSKEAMRRELEALRQKNEELELRISTNIQKIRVRERELENRLELVKMEGSALIRSKDEMILDLKRQMDQLNMELQNYRNKNQDLNRQSSEKQEILRRTVKALRLALSMLEGEEESPNNAEAPQPLRKVK